MSTDKPETSHGEKHSTEKAIEEKASTQAKQPEKSHMHSKDAATPKDANPVGPKEH